MRNDEGSPVPRANSLWLKVMACAVILAAGATGLARQSYYEGAYELAVELLGPERVVFGTDLPGADYYVNAGRVLELDVPDATKQQIFADNILRILGRS